MNFFDYFFAHSSYFLGIPPVFLSSALNSGAEAYVHPPHQADWECSDRVLLLEYSLYAPCSHCFLSSKFFWTDWGSVLFEGDTFDLHNNFQNFIKIFHWKLINFFRSKIRHRSNEKVIRFLNICRCKTDFFSSHASLSEKEIAEFSINFPCVDLFEFYYFFSSIEHHFDFFFHSLICKV